MEMNGHPYLSERKRKRTTGVPRWVFAMTSSHQKQLERSILDFYLLIIGLDGKVVPQESPDFVVTSHTGRIGVEITEYHQPTYSGHNFSRTQVEAEWDRIRAAVVEYRESHTGLENLSVRLSFTNLRVPDVNQYRHFIGAIHNEINRVKPDLGDRFTTIRIDDQHSAVLRRYLKSIDVRVANCYMEWDWNHTFAWVGTSEDELVNILSRKLSLAPAEDIDELHLVMAGDGPTGGSYIGYLSPELLNGWAGLKSALDRSYYDIVAILNYQDTCIWQRRQGWSLIKHDRSGLAQVDIGGANLRDRA